MQREDPDEDAAWQAIVDNYGERAELEPEAEPEPVRVDPADDLDEPAELEHDDPGDPEDDIPVFDRFVPEDPPPVPIPPFDRLLAWAGVFGSPTILLVFLISGLSMPGWLGWLLVGGFVLGFCYLVIRMPGSPRDPWDDGARV
ncbi:hypothetical protein [Pimelobacter simplex]|uniref:hypothetical protein n=1 Tax=Nocardioides simplex TaxID=2045 RepID=UPI003AAB1C79